MARGSDTRSKLIDAALQQVGTQGYRAATTKIIAAAAGLNEATIFRLFGNKDALVRVAIYERTISAKSLPSAEQHYAPTLEADFASILREYVRSVITQIPIYRIFMMRTEYDVKMNAEIAAKAQTITAHFAAHLTFLRKAGRVIDTDYTALAELMASLYLITVIDLTNGEREESEISALVGEFAERYARYLSSILAPTPEA